jgi:ArsR family transcriptional regulator, arsenate/arsenite/antimonite-responsive transcriptional repressor
MKLFVKVMKALSDPNRIKIMKMLQQKSMCVCEIQESLRLAQPTISKHLKILEEAGLVTFWKEGLWVNYALAREQGPSDAVEMTRFLEKHLNDDPEIRRIVERLPFINREEICSKQGRIIRD